MSRGVFRLFARTCKWPIYAENYNELGHKFVCDYIYIDKAYFKAAIRRRGVDVGVGVGVAVAVGMRVGVCPPGKSELCAQNGAN